MKEKLKLSTTCKIGISDYLEPVLRRTGNAVIFQYYIGLPGTDNPHIVGKLWFSKKSKMRSRPKRKWFTIE